jgi:hypothetical protein
MPRRPLALLLTILLLPAGLAPAAGDVSDGGGAHACCRTMDRGAPHEGCPQAGAPKMRCCAAPADRGAESQAPPASGATSHQPDFAPLRAHAAHVPELPDLARASVAHAFERARLRLPHDRLYLRHLVLLV